MKLESLILFSLVCSIGLIPLENVFSESTYPTNIVALDAETDGVNGFTELDGARGVDTFTIGTSTYAIVTAYDDDGVQMVKFVNENDHVQTYPTPESISESIPNCGTGTELVNGICQVTQTKEKSSTGGGCLIATATFGSEMEPQVQFLRELRDNTVLQTESGTSFMAGFNQFYYSFSPYVADYERENPAFKETVKLALTPLLTSLTLLQYVDIDSESEMLGYGIGVILLNIGMYFVAPAVLIMAVRKRI